MRPPPVGDPSAIKLLRSVIFTGIEGAAAVYPSGFLRKRWAPGSGWLGRFITVEAAAPLPNSRVYVAVTSDDLRIFGRPMFSSPFEIGRWEKGSYRASIPDSGVLLKLDLELEQLGRVRVMSGLRVYSGAARQVFDLVVRYASGPVVGP